MNKFFFLAILFHCAMAFTGFSQDTLPEFSLKNMGSNRIVIGWKNTFPNVKQISIQRSFDSSKNFTSILTVVDPTLPQNGYMDTKAPYDKMFYRVYVLLEQGRYFFSKPKRPVPDAAAYLSSNTYYNARQIKVQELLAGFVPSHYVYTNVDGYVKVYLPEDQGRQYDLKFFDSNDEFLFELKNIKERNFKLDKASFYSAGWKHFELYENGKLKEKYRFYLWEEF